MLSALISACGTACAGTTGNEHAAQLILHAAVALYCIRKSLPQVQAALRAPHLASKSQAENVIGVGLGGFLVINFLKKGLGRGAAAMIEMVLPCHFFNALATYVLLSQSRLAREVTYNIILYCTWMPLCALAFPDLGASRAIVNPIVRQLDISLFWVHHVLLFAVPVYMHIQSAAGRFHVRANGSASAFVQYVAFAYTYIGVALCAIALVTGRNLNYSLTPPKTAGFVDVAIRSSGPYYRVMVGAALAFVVGPLMRWLVVPALSAACMGVLKCCSPRRGRKAE